MPPTVSVRTNFLVHKLCPYSNTYVLFIKGWMNQPQSCDHKRALPTSQLSCGGIDREMMPSCLPINA